MTPGMTQKRKSGNARGSGDRWLTPGALVLVDDDELVRRSMRRFIEDVIGSTVLTAADLGALRSQIHPQKTRPGGRPPVRGFLLDWFLDRKRGITAAEVIEWLDGVYPRTPVVIYTGLDGVSPIQLSCRGKACSVLPAARHPASPDPIRRALLGRVDLPSGPAPILARLDVNQAALAALESQLFAPWDGRRLEARRWALAQLPRGQDATEAQLRTLDAYFESVPPEHLPHARGILPSTLEGIANEIAHPSRWGASLESLKQRWEASHFGRGAHTAPLQPWHDPEPPPEPAPPRRPAARRRRS